MSTPPLAGRALIIEDHRDLADNIAECLADEGYTPFVATSAREAIETASRDAFDIAFLDVRLPDADGTQTLLELKRCAPHAEVVVMSGEATVESAIATVRGGAFAYILKPFPFDEVLRLARLAMVQVSLRREREALVRQLQDSEARYRTVVEASPAIILGVRDDGVVALANTAAEHAVGVARGALLGRDVHELVPAGTRPAAWPDGSAELTLRAHDGTERRIEWRFGSADGLHYALGIDVTETRAIERRVRVAEHLAVVGELTAGLAHEIRNPLNSALLELKVLSRRLARLDDPASVASANTVRSELDRLERLLAEFLWFARPRSMAEAAEGDLAHPAAAVARLVQAEAHARNVEVRTDFEATCPTVTFVEDRVRQVVLNLVRNALEALPTGGRISIRTRSVGSRAELSVEDDGPGIEGDPQRVFLPFHTTKSNGTGLGLTIAQRIAADHGGELGVESRPGRTVFTLSIPSRS